jgi:VRR-NUC domain
MLESKIQEKLTKLYESQGYDVTNIIRCNKSGTPDLLLIDKKTSIASWVEVKAENGVISQKQKLRAKQLRSFCKVRFVTEGDRDIDESDDLEVFDF